MGCGLSKAHIHPEVLVANANARTTFHGRLLIVQRHQMGWAQAHIAAAMGVSRKCVKTWVELGVPARTISRVLTRRGVPRLTAPDPLTGQVIRASKASARPATPRSQTGPRSPASRRHCWPRWQG